MANIIKQKRGTTDPAASDLVVGELAINTTDGGVFTKTDGGTVVELGASINLDTSPQLGGDLASNGHDILVADNDHIIVGTGTDLQIYHNSANGHSVITESGSGNLNISADNLVIYNSAATETKAKFVSDGAVALYYDNVKKFETTSTGATVTGTCVATEFSGSGASLTGVVKTDATGISGASTVSNIVTISQADYDAISSPDASTIYYITS